MTDEQRRELANSKRSRFYRCMNGRAVSTPWDVAAWCLLHPADNRPRRVILAGPGLDGKPWREVVR